MAYLKGGSYVDGDFCVEGALKVNRIVNSLNDYFPYLSVASGSRQDYLVIFGDNTGGIRFSPIKITGGNNQPVTVNLSVDGGVSSVEHLTATTNSWLIKNINPKDIEINTPAVVKLDYSLDIPRWVYE